MHRISIVAILLSVGCARTEPAAPTSVASHLDFSSVHAFWEVEAQLAANVEPSEDDWERLLRTPGYARWNGARTSLPLAMRHAFRPNAPTVDTDHPTPTGYLRRIAATRAELDAFEARWPATEAIAHAWAFAQEWLPAEAARGKSPPPVDFVLFEPDGYSVGDAIVLDERHAADLNPVQLEKFLGHELHHTLTRGLQEARSERHPQAWTVLDSLLLEGVADLIDKEVVPLRIADVGAGLEGYVASYNIEFSRAPETLARLDSLLRELASGGDEKRLMATAKRLLPFNGHPVGLFMARSIRDVLGHDAVVATLPSPALFALAYERAVRTRDRADIWSPEARALLESLRALAAR